MANEHPVSSDIGDFAQVFEDSVRAGLNNVLGQSGASAVLIHLQMVNDLLDPSEFHKSLLKLFGPQGTLSLERAVLKELITRLRRPVPLPKSLDGFDFSTLIRVIKEGDKPQ